MHMSSTFEGIQYCFYGKKVAHFDVWRIVNEQAKGVEDHSREAVVRERFVKLCTSSCHFGNL
jgi:hypothetical protein